MKSHTNAGDWPHASGNEEQDEYRSLCEQPVANAVPDRARLEVMKTFNLTRIAIEDNDGSVWWPSQCGK